MDGFRELEPERKPKRCWVKAQNEQEALAGAADLLVRKEEDLEILSSRAGQYHVGLRFVEVELSFAVSASKMEVVVVSISAPSDAQPPTVATVTRQLTLAGVCVGHDEEAIAEFLDSTKTGELNQSLIVARGVPPVQGRDGALEPLANLEGAVVFPGEAFARVIPTQKPCSGQTVFGLELEAPPGTAPFNLELGEGCVLDSVANQITAIGYGYAWIEGEKVGVRSGLHLSPDAMHAEMEIGPHQLDGRPVSVADLRAAIEAAGIDQDCLDLEVLRTSVKAAWEEGGRTERVCVARAKPAIVGRPEWMDVLGEDGQFFFSEQAVLKVHPPSTAAPGKDIFGISLEPGEAIEEEALEIGDGLQRTKDGGSVVAAFPGWLKREDKKLSLRPAVRISPDGLSCLVDVPPLNEDGQPFTSEQLTTWMGNAGVLAEFVDQDAVERSLKLSTSKNEVIENCMLAVGRAPTESWGAEYKALKAGSRTAALPGDVLVEIQKPDAAQPGMTVKGAPIHAPPSASNEGAFLAGTGCEEGQDAIVATIYGRVVFEGQTVSVEPTLRIEEDDRVARLRIFVKRIGGERMEEEGLLAFLQESGIDMECIDRTLLKKALRGSKSREIRVARAIEPVAAQDAKLCTGGSGMGFGVFPEDQVAWVEPLVQGQPGKTVLGAEIPLEREPLDLALIPGSYCVLSDENGAVVARAYGMANLVPEESKDGRRAFRVDIHPAIRVDEERHRCFMDIFPETMHGELVGVETLVQVLRDSGVVDQSINRKSIAEALSLSVGEIQRDVLVAEGQKPSSGQDWSVVVLGEAATAAVFPGDAIAEVRAESPGLEGWDLEGNAIPLEDAELGLSLHTRLHCELSDDGTQALADVYGRPDVKGISVRVLPGFRVGPSDFSLRMDVFPTRSDGTRITESDLLEQLKLLDIPEEFLRREAISDALRLAWTSNLPQWHIEVARGALPEKGQDGKVEPVGDHGQGCVFPGDVVAAVVAEVPPKPGTTVFGAPIPAPGLVRPASVIPEVGCELRNQTEVVATQYGRPFLDGKKVIVQSSLYLASDGMRLAMDLFSKRSNGERVQLDSILEVLRSKGLPEDFLDEDALAAGLKEAENRGGIFWDFEVATGTQPIAGEDGSASRIGGEKGCVFPGDSFARFHPHKPGEPGRTVDGRLVQPTEEPQKVRLLQAEGAKIAPDGLLAIAEVYGEPTLEDTLAGVKPGFRIEADEMSATMDIWSAKVTGEPVRLEELKDFILSAGLEEECIDEAAITEALGQAMESGEVVRDVCVARGIAPQSGVDGSASFPDKMDISCVFPGDVVGKLVLPVLPQPGLTVRGKKLNPEDGVKEFKFATKEGVRFDAGTLELKAEIYGHLNVARGRVTERSGTGVTVSEQIEVGVEPGVIFNETRLACRMNIFPQTLTGAGVEESVLRQVLVAAGVKDDRILGKVLAGARRAAARQLQPQMGITVAKGLYPKHGQDGALELTVVSTGQAGETGAFGRIDFREQKGFVEVTDGMTLATLSLPSEGSAGITVTGESIDARDGKEGSLEVGPGAELRDGVVCASRRGVLSIRGNFIDVVELLVIEGDVDYRTGNVKVKTGSVRISGSVLPGFEVICPDDVEVGEVVEGAKIVAGGNIVVRGGVVAGTDTECSIVAGGEINVGLARNSTLKAKGDVVVQKELLHCEVETEGRLLADRKPGLVSGGSIKARRGAMVCQLGSSQWTPTLLRVGGTVSRVSDLQRELGGIRRQRTRLNDRLEGKTDGEILSSCSPAELPQVEALCAQREAVRAEVAKMEMELNDLIAKHEAEPAAIVVIKESLFPRVVLNFPQGQYNAEVQVSRARFYFNPQERQIEHLDIGAPLPDFLGYSEDDD